MKLGIEGKWALVCAASKGLGKGCAKALVMEGVNVIITARGAEALEATATELHALNPDVRVETVAGNINTPAGRAAALAAVGNEAPHIDILINNVGGPPPGDFRNWTRDDWMTAVDASMLTPIDLVRSVIDGMCERGFGRIVNITSAAVKAPIDTLGLSNGARSGLTGFVAGLALQPQVDGRNVTINGLLPGPFDTERVQTMIANWAKRDGKTYDELAATRVQTVPARRFGTADEFGATCAFLCSVHAGYITGQNVLLDGGSFSGTF